MRHVRLWRSVSEDIYDENQALGCCLTFLYNLQDEGIKMVHLAGHTAEAAYVSFKDNDRYSREEYIQKLTDLLCEYPDIREINKSIIDTLDVQRIFRLGDNKTRNYEFCQKLDEIVS